MRPAHAADVADVADHIHLRQQSYPLLSSLVALEAIRSLYAELALYPKPGLVSLVDNGSHDDMDATTFMRSIASLRSYFRQITQAGAGDADFPALAALGIAAERHMLTATGGVNTHRGAIFCLGLLCAAGGRAFANAYSKDAAGAPGDAKSNDDANNNDDVGRAPGSADKRNAASTAFTVGCSADMIRSTLLKCWGTELAGHCAQRLTAAHGTGAARVHGIGGARAEAAAGLPSIFEIALPAMQRTLAAGRDWQCARTDAFFALLAAVDDTNVYHRGGACGAALVRYQARQFIDNGGTANRHWRRDATGVHRLFVDRRLSPGGAADLLAGTCLVIQLTRNDGVNPAWRIRKTGAVTVPSS